MSAGRSDSISNLLPTHSPSRRLQPLSSASSPLSIAVQESALSRTPLISKIHFVLKKKDFNPNKEFP